MSKTNDNSESAGKKNAEVDMTPKVVLDVEDIKLPGDTRYFKASARKAYLMDADIFVCVRDKKTGEFKTMKVATAAELNTVRKANAITKQEWQDKTVDAYRISSVSLPKEDDSNFEAWKKDVIDQARKLLVECKRETKYNRETISL